MDAYNSMGIDVREKCSFVLDVMCCCLCSCLILLVIAGPLILIVSIVGLGFSQPSVYVQELQLYAQTTATLNSSSIFIDLKFHRPMAFTSPTYKDFKISLSYGLDRSFPLANHTLPGFTMGHSRTVHKEAAMEASRRLPGVSPLPLLVKLLQKYKIHFCSIDVDSFSDECSWTREAEAVVADAVVWLDVSGHKLSHKPIILRWRIQKVFSESADY